MKMPFIDLLLVEALCCVEAADVTAVNRFKDSKIYLFSK